MANLQKYGMLIFWALMVGALLIFTSTVLEEFRKTAKRI